MARLTERRFQQAENILEEYRNLLFTNLEYSADKFEAELKKCWEVGYQEIKDLMIDLIREPFKTSLV